MVLKARISSVTDRYAEALLTLAKRESLCDQVEADLQGLYILFESNVDFRRLVVSPIFSQSQQISGLFTVSKVLALAPLTRNFLKVLITKRRLLILPSVILSWMRKFSQYHGKTIVEVVTARPLSKAQRITLGMAITTASGRQSQPTIRLDPSLLGGLFIQVGSWIVDSSLHTKLQRLRISMKGVR